MAVFRPDPNQAVLVVAAVDIVAVEAQLRPQLLDRLCVVPSRWSREQLDGVTTQLWERARQWGVYGTGQSCDEQAQAVVHVKLESVTDEIASWADTQPVGLVVLKPCLTPIGIDNH
ncbi:MAG: hypothetical protein H0X35_07895 [Pseudonocardiales bacterium]|nr:hypothetical protein [Pseudonocardiales bacterium]